MRKRLLSKDLWQKMKGTWRRLPFKPRKLRDLVDIRERQQRAT